MRGRIDSFRRLIDSLWREWRNSRVPEALADDSPKGINMLREVRLSSSTIERACYDEEEKSLSLWFKETGRYIYSDVPRAVFDGLKKAPSAGRYFNECIKRRFPCRPDPERKKFRPDFCGARSFDKY
jgi:hypothetical protein